MKPLHDKPRGTEPGVIEHLDLVFGTSLVYWALRKIMNTVIHSITAAVLLGFLLILSAQRLPAAEANHPFIPGEKLTFDLKWGAIGAGEAVLRVLPSKTIDDRDVYHFELTARSGKTIDRIFRIRDRMESYADFVMNHSLLYREKIREGGYRKDRVVTFDWEKNEVVYVSGSKAPRRMAVMPGTFDPVAAFYYVRVQLKDGLSKIERPITDGKKNVIGRVNILRRVKVSVGNRTFDTFELKPVMDDVELFSADKDSDIRIWVTADKRRLPVLIQSRIAWGVFRAELRRVEYIPLPAQPRDK